MIEETFIPLLGNQRNWGTSLKCLYTNVCNMRNCSSVCVGPQSQWHQRRSGIAHRNDVLAWMDTASLGKTGQDSEVRELPFM